MNATPSTLGPYEVITKLARGGMATAYLARKAGEAGFERVVVLKRVHPHLAEDAGLRDAVRDEARIAASIHHPNVVPVEDVIEAGTELCLVMPYIESASLGDLLAKRTNNTPTALPAPIASRVLLDVLAGLEAAHEARDLRGETLGLVHRDVSPRNILVGSDGETRLIDFGVAKARGRLGQTTSGVMKGTLAYMSPEQLRRREIDRRSDVFAAASVLFEALSGRRLFDGRDEADILISVLADEITKLEGEVALVTSGLDDVLAQALARDPDERFPTARAFAEALEQAIAPASPRDVAALVHERFATELEERRRSIRVFLDRMASTKNNKTSETVRPIWLKRRWFATGASIVGLGLVGLARLQNREQSAPRLSPALSQFQLDPKALLSADPPTTTREREGTRQLSLNASFVILELQTAGILRSEISGKKARLWVEPWSGTLIVEAKLEGGQNAIAHFDAKTGDEATLVVPVNRPPMASTQASERVRPGTKEARPPPNELQVNPYR